MDDLRVVHKIVDDKKVLCKLKDLKSGDWFTIAESTTEGIPFDTSMVGYSGSYDPDHRFRASSDPYLNEDIVWTIAIDEDTL